MKKRIAIVATILAVGMLAAVPLVNAEPGPGRGGHHRGFGGFGMLGHIGRVADELGLSDQQKDEIKAIFTDLHQQNQTYREQMHGGFKDITEVLLKNPNDLSSAQALLDQQAASEKQLKSNMLAATSKALNVLTADQRAKLSQMIEERAERRAAKGRRR